jgi:hypothetical protein
MAIVDATSTPVGSTVGTSNTNQFNDLLFAHKANQAVMVKMHR